MCRWNRSKGCGRPSIYSVVCRCSVFVTNTPWLSLAVTESRAWRAVRELSLKMAVSFSCLSRTVFAPDAIVRPCRLPLKLTLMRPVVGPLTCTTRSRPRSISLRRSVTVAVLGRSPFPGLLSRSLEPEPVLGPGSPEVLPPPPGKLLVGTVRLMCAELSVLLSPAALVSHTASVQVPGPGTVTIAGPSAGAVVGVLQAPGPVAGQTW